MALPSSSAPTQVYNFYTWAEQINDFVAEVVGQEGPVTLVANSIGSISALQAAIDVPGRSRGVAARRSGDDDLGHGEGRITVATSGRPEECV